MLYGLAFATHAAPPKQMQARVGDVRDGDTIVVIDPQQKRYVVQMDGVDAPELDQPYGETSKKNLERRLYKKNVVVVWNKTGTDGTLVAKVMVNNGDFNQLQLRTGSAWATGEITVNYSGNDKKKYAAAEAVAKEKQLGLWRNPGAVAPWEWRKKKEAATPAAPPADKPVRTDVMPKQ